MTAQRVIKDTEFRNLTINQFYSFSSSASFITHQEGAAGDDRPQPGRRPQAAAAAVGPGRLRARHRHTHPIPSGPNPQHHQTPLFMVPVPLPSILQPALSLLRPLLSLVT